MYVNTKKVLDELCKANPMMTREEVVRFVIRRTQKNNKSTVNYDKWISGGYILLYSEGYKALKELFEKCPTMDADGVFYKQLPDDVMVAAQIGKDVKVVTQDEYFEGRRKSAQARSGERSNFTNDNGRIIEILAEIATLQHSIGLKLDNIARLVDKGNGKTDELVEALNGIRKVRHDS